MFNYRDTPIFLHIIQIQSRNTYNIHKNHFKISTKEEQLYVQDMASLSHGIVLFEVRMYIHGKKLYLVNWYFYVSFES